MSIGLATIPQKLSKLSETDLLQFRRNDGEPVTVQAQSGALGYMIGQNMKVGGVIHNVHGILGE